MLSAILVSLCVGTASSFSFVQLQRKHAFDLSSSSLHMAVGNKKVGIFFGTSTGNTENAAYTIASELGDIADGPFEIDEFAGSVAKKFDEYDALIVGE